MAAPPGDRPANPVLHGAGAAGPALRRLFVAHPQRRRPAASRAGGVVLGVSRQLKHVGHPDPGRGEVAAEQRPPPNQSMPRPQSPCWHRLRPRRPWLPGRDTTGEIRRLRRQIQLPRLADRRAFGELTDSPVSAGAERYGAIPILFGPRPRTGSSPRRWSGQVTKEAPQPGESSLRRPRPSTTSTARWRHRNG